MTFQQRLFFLINEGNGLSFYLIPTCTLSCCTCIKFADVLFGAQSWEKKQESGNEWETPWESRERVRERGRRRNDRRHFPQGESWKAPQQADRQSRVSDDRPCPAVPPAFPESLLNFYWIWNVKRRGTYVLSFFSVFFSAPPCLPLSVHRQVCHATGAQPQTVNADKINFLMLIPVGTERIEGEKKRTLQPCVKLGVCPLHLSD